MRKELDLRSCRRVSNGTRTGWLRAFYTPAAALLLVGLCAAGAIGMQNRTLAREISAAQRWLEETEPQYLQAEGKWAYHEALVQRRQLTEDLTAALATYPAITSGLIDRIAAVGGDRVVMTLEGWDAGTGTLSFLARSGEVLEIPSYIQALRETGLFRSVEYTGYRYQQEGYSLVLHCVLEEGGEL